MDRITTLDFRRFALKRVCFAFSASMLVFTVGSMATMLFSNAFAQDNVKSKLVSQVPKWEYKVIRQKAFTPAELETEKIENKLNAVGEEGWELVGTVSETMGGAQKTTTGILVTPGTENWTNAVLILKRQKQ